MFTGERGINGAQARALAQEFGVVTDIFERDYLLNALIWSKKGNVGAAYRDYIAGGRADAEAIQNIIKSYFGERLELDNQNPPPPALTVLDFACGYGRIGRHFRNVMPEIHYAGMDIHVDAIRFNRDKLGLRTIRSAHKPQEFCVSETFDFIFALSFFSHVRDKHFLGWLTELHKLLKPRGVLMFSTHGRVTHRLYMPEVAVGARGYGMLVTSEQFDLSTAFYVHAITYREYVERMIGDVDGLQLLNFSEGFWFGHQDMYILQNAVPASRGIEGRLKPLTAALRRITNAPARALWSALRSTGHRREA
ncbi:MAG: class I SAM-dependent methyltransferase [Beijerinckiaceae bacterium]|nr:class I SAM-dependent methyltransferase [Beijerinckiaceae bacterium]MCI0736900.1 class I SAM-dependent methyltransferase [Beijerinckiaceae bacterium]